MLTVTIFSQVWISIGTCISLYGGKSVFVLFPSAGTDISVFTENFVLFGEQFPQQPST